MNVVSRFVEKRSKRKMTKRVLSYFVECRNTSKIVNIYTFIFMSLTKLNNNEIQSIEAGQDSK